MNDNSYKVIEVDINEILPNRFQPRIKFDEEEILELSDSIKEHGVIQPIVVRTIGDKYEIIAGERRYKASVLAGKETVPVIIKNLNDKDSAEIALIENIQRKNLTPIEEALSYKKILDMGYITQENLAIKLGKSQSAVANKIRLLNLSDEVQEALLENKISERHARSLLRLKSLNDQNKMLEKIINERLTVRKTDDEIDKIINLISENNNVIEKEEKGEINMNNEFNQIPNIVTPQSSGTFDIFANAQAPVGQNNNQGVETIQNVEQTSTAPVVEQPIINNAPMMPSFEIPAVEPQNPSILDFSQKVEVQEPVAQSMPTMETFGFNTNTSVDFNEQQQTNEVNSNMTIPVAEEPIINNAPMMPSFEMPTVEQQNASVVDFSQNAEAQEPVAQSMPTMETFGFNLNNPVSLSEQPQINQINSAMTTPVVEEPTISPAPMMPSFEMPVVEQQNLSTLDFNQKVEGVESAMMPNLDIPNFGTELKQTQSVELNPVSMVEEQKDNMTEIPFTSPIMESNNNLNSTIANEPIIITDFSKQYDPVMPNMVEPQINKVDFKEIISAIRECSEKIEKYGYKIDVEEYDLSTLYQVVFKIEK